MPEPEYSEEQEQEQEKVQGGRRKSRKSRKTRKQRQQGGQDKQQGGQDKQQGGQDKQQGGRRKSRKSKRAPSQWTKFVTKVYHEMKKKDKNVKLGAAMKEASRRKKRGDIMSRPFRPFIFATPNDENHPSILGRRPRLLNNNESNSNSNGEITPQMLSSNRATSQYQRALLKCRQTKKNRNKSSKHYNNYKKACAAAAAAERTRNETFHNRDRAQNLARQRAEDNNIREGSPNIIRPNIPHNRIPVHPRGYNTSNSNNNSNNNSSNTKRRKLEKGGKRRTRNAKRRSSKHA